MVLLQKTSDQSYSDSIPTQFFFHAFKALRIASPRGPAEAGFWPVRSVPDWMTLTYQSVESDLRMQLH